MSDESSSAAAGERLAKVIARAGLCSRRDAEEWIRGGRVVVNGTTIRTPAYNVTPRDRIAVDGQPLVARSGTRVWLYHKPPGLVVTEKDPEGRPTIFEALAEAGLPRVLTVGRLDLNTEGLLLLTNDGGLKRVLELPSTGWLRRYRVRAFGSVTQEQLASLKDGVEVEGIRYGPIEAVLERQQGANVWLVVALREGKNREVKNVLASLGLAVNRLIRVSYGPFQLGDLPVGAVEVVRARVLRDQLGSKLAAQTGVDFDSDLPEAGTQRPAGRGTERSRPPGRTNDARRGNRQEAPSGRTEERPPRPAGPRVFFDDGRPPEDYVAPEERRPRRGEPTSARPGRGRPQHSDRDKPFAASRPRTSRPGTGDRQGRGERPATGSARPSRDGLRPARSGMDRPRAPRPDAERPRGPRPGADHPRSPRRVSAQPARPGSGSNRSADRPEHTGDEATRPRRTRTPRPMANSPAATPGRPAVPRRPGSVARPARPRGPGSGPRPPRSNGPGSRAGKPPRKPRS